MIEVAEWTMGVSVIQGYYNVPVSVYTVSNAIISNQGKKLYLNKALISAVYLCIGKRQPHGEYSFVASTVNIRKFILTQIIHPHLFIYKI